ncbi:MAG TPA: tetratricopeptide repeat protein [Vicinamibacterales bacterium]|nr:tetratricopeptide repeat protein [Vicinamibacterales bacterium]
MSNVRRGTIAIALVLCAATGLARAQVPPSVPPSGRDASWLHQMDALIARGKVDDAVAAARQRPETDPDARVVLARAALRTGRVAEAQQLLRPVAEADPAGEAALELALLARARGRVEEATLLLEPVAAGAASARDVPALLRAARAAAALGEFRQANQLFRRASRAAGGDPAVETAWGSLFLEKHNHQDAARSFGEALKADGEWAPAHAGLARALADLNPPAAAEAASRALAIDPGLIDAYVVRARLELDASHRAEARQTLQTTLERNPESLEARSLLAAVARLEDRASEFEAEAARVQRSNPAFAGAYDAASDLLARAYRFEEAVALGRKAAAIDPSNAAVLARLGLNLMRTGDEAEARQMLDAAFRIDPYDVVTYNLLTLLDTLDDFETVEDGAFQFRFHKNEAGVLGEYAPALAREAFAALSKRYGFKPQGPILVEVFPRHDDFAVRTLGLPGLLGALGACFGRVVTMDSPKAQPPNTFSWQATLWHELAHVFTLQMSKQRVPRWLTEGISVYEEGRARPEWGREMEVTFARAWRDGKAIPLADLNAAFTRPETIALAYYQASLLVEHLVRMRGDAGLIALLRAFGDGMENEAALRHAFGVSLDALQEAFDSTLKARFEGLAHALREVPALKDATTPEALRALAEEQPDSFAVQVALGRALATAGDRPGAIAAYERAAALVPQATGPESPRAQIAALATAAGEQRRAMEELRTLVSVDHTSVDAARQLLTLAERAGDGATARVAAARVVALDPFDSAAHTTLGRAALAAGDLATALREFGAAITTGPADAAAAHCDLGEAYFASGRPAEAKRQALASLEVAPLFERAQELLLKTVEGRR